MTETEAADAGLASTGTASTRLASTGPASTGPASTRTASTAPGSPRGRGELRIYLGSAAGVGKTFAMLGEGHRRAERGTDTVIAFVETHGRAQTEAQIGDLEVIPRARLAYRGTFFEDMDLAAVLARAPEVALVDEFAHTNVPGSKHHKRWQDVEDLLAAGIDVISTISVGHLDSLADVVAKVTGIAPAQTVPDSVVRAAADSMCTSSPAHPTPMAS